MHLFLSYRLLFSIILYLLFPCPSCQCWPNITKQQIWWIWTWVLTIWRMLKQTVELQGNLINGIQITYFNANKHCFVKLKTCFCQYIDLQTFLFLTFCIQMRWLIPDYTFNCRKQSTGKLKKERETIPGNKYLSRSYLLLFCFNT